MTWSTDTWLEISPIYERIVSMPFITALRDGSLELEKFKFYMKQDSGYLEHFGKALAIIGSRADDPKTALTFMQFASNAILVENALHESYFKEFGVQEGNTILEPACHHYVHFLKSTAALEPIEVAMAAVLPCFWIYKEVGDFIYKNQVSITNPYQKWIETYSGEEFGVAVREAIRICDRVAMESTAAIRAKMTQAFVTSSRLEFEFWDSAFQFRVWG